MNSKRENKSSDSLIDLYSRIPDYSEVQHLGNSDFINTLEQLKEEFRRCRASLYDSDLDYISDKTSKVLNISSDDRDHSKSAKDTDRNLVGVNKGRNYLSITSCELHRNPFSGSGSYLHKANRSLSFKNDSKNDSAFHDDYDMYSGASTPDSCLSRWSSSPEIYSHRKEFIPPSNIEQRLLSRKPQNNSAPSVAKDEEIKVHFRANPVPSHVYKPLFEYIMLKNKKRSQRVREQSKQKLLAQVKPFSFSNDTKANIREHKYGMISGAAENLNNTKPSKNRKISGSTHQCIKTNNNKFPSAQYFKANPAPPRTKALLSAIRLKEQQDYRELKKRLRAEALMKTASLPPSMAARNRRIKFNNATLEAIMKDYGNTQKRERKFGRYQRASSADSTGYTDDDRMTEDSYANSKVTTIAKPFKFSDRKSKNFTSYGKSRYSAAANGVFESTSNDNLASRLRVQAAKVKEESRIEREEEEIERFMLAERRRQKLRDSHLHAWRRACSYSSAQDIAMRRQLRMAASILERESFRKDMSTMLSRVRSAPLLLEGVRVRKFEPCKKHREELQMSSARSINKSGTPRFELPNYTSRSNWTSQGIGEERSETAALAEGSLTNSDNESVKNIALDFDDEKTHENDPDDIHPHDDEDNGEIQEEDGEEDNP